MSSIQLSNICAIRLFGIGFAIKKPVFIDRYTSGTWNGTCLQAIYIYTFIDVKPLTININVANVMY